VYPTRAGRVTALAPIDLDIQPGEFLVLLGPSGCGKTTLLRMLGGLVPPTTGSITIGGKELWALKERADYDVLGNLGFVFQEPNLLPWRSVWKNIALPLEVRGVRRAERFQRARELAETMGLGGFLHHLPRALSGGMRQRVAIARALSQEPSILLMDEPFGALDAMTRDQMNLMLQDLWIQTGKTIVLVTHSIPEAVFLADRVVLLTPRPGRIQRIVSVPFARPRGLQLVKEKGFNDLVAELRAELGEIDLGEVKL
jgi:NitT/TauT family transport system ATP-binding protein